MPRLTTTWILCLGLAVTRLLGLHIHVCAGLEFTTHAHEAPHYADVGLLFDTPHDADHADDRELDPTGVTSTARVMVGDADQTALPPNPEWVMAASDGAIVLPGSRAPPAQQPPHPDYFTPPKRGPPTTLVT